MDLWQTFKKSKSNFIVLWILLGIALIAVYAPLISNNKPLFIYTRSSLIYQDMLDSAEGTLQLILADLKAGRNPVQKKVDWLSESMKEALGFIENRAEINSLLYENIEVLVQRKDTESLNQVLENLKQLEKSPLKARCFFPAFKSLSPSDLFFMLIPPLLMLFFLFNKRWHFFQKKTFWDLLAVSVFGALILSLAFSFFKEDRFDPYRYKLMAENFQKGEWAIFPVVPYGENENILTESSQPPTFLLKVSRGNQHFHLLGTDTNGRDVLGRMIYGARVSMSVGFVAVGIYVILGIFIGALAGFYGGWVDTLISRWIEIMICFPVFFLILTVMAFLKPSIFNIMVIIGLTGWPGIARLMRGEFLKLKNQEFVLAAQAMGASDFRMIFYHIFPNGVNPILISATFGIAGAILTESALSFLGFGVPQPTASWGDILNNGRNDIYGSWWLTVFPGAAIFVTVTCFNLIGEKLRDLLDPRMKAR